MIVKKSSLLQPVLIIIRYLLHTPVKHISPHHHRHILMCTQRKMSSSTTQGIGLFLVLNSVSLTSAQNNYDDISIDVSNIFGHVTEATHTIEDESWKLSNGQIFVILITFFIVVFLIILCCAARRNRKPQERDVTPSPSLPVLPQSHSLCQSCQNTIHSLSQLTVNEDPYPPAYDSIYSTAQSRAMFLNHDQNRHNGPQPSAPPVTELH